MIHSARRQVLVRMNAVEDHGTHVATKNGVLVPKANGVIHMDRHTGRQMVPMDSLQISAEAVSVPDRIARTVFIHPMRIESYDEVPESAMQSTSCMAHRSGKCPFKRGDMLLFPNGSLHTGDKVKRGYEELTGMDSNLILAKRGSNRSTEPLFDHVRCEPYWEGDPSDIRSIGTYPQMAVVMEVPKDKRWMTMDLKAGDIIIHKGGHRCQGFNGDAVMFIAEPKIDAVVGTVSLIAHNTIKAMVATATQYMRGDSRW